MSEQHGPGAVAHPIVRLNFLTRLIACPLVATVLLATRFTGGDGVPALLIAAFAVYALAWPHAAYAFSRRTGDSERELRLLMVDSAVTGAAIALLSFRLLPSLSLLVPVATFSASIGGAPFMLRGVSAMVVAALFVAAFTGHFAVKETGAVAQAVAAGGLVIFQTLLGLFTFRTARAFADSRRELAAQAEEIRRRNAELVEARESALEAAKAKSAFLATMSHEIRTPLNGVLGMARLLAETPLSAEQHDLLRTVRASGDTLVTVINDILDFSRVESGRLELEREPMDVVDVVEESLEIVSDVARRKGLELVCEIDGDAPCPILGDATRLRQVVTNLAGNAVKFTEEGEVVVRVRQLPAQDGEEGSATIGVSVRDTGIGIPADRIGDLFTAFSQADSSTTRRYGGTGLGLAISKRLVGLMGGDIAVESQPGSGSTFSFTIHGDLAPREEGRRAAAATLAGRRVLVVDDNATNRRALCGQLALWGLVPCDAAGGEEALGLLHREGPFDLAILDYHMPSMDGMTLARRIRAGSDAPALPLVLLSSSLVLASDDTDRLFAARLLKPARQSSLLDAVATAMSGTRAGVATGAVASGEREDLSSGLKVLVVDDNDINRDIAHLVLRRFGGVADEATGGAEALDIVVRASGAGEGYDLVLMDVQMPGMDGLEATRAIRALQAAKPSQKWPRIVAMTANALHEDRTACQAAGMDDYLTKPLVFEELGRVLREASGFAQPPVAAMGGAEPPAGDLIDWARLDELAEYDSDDGALVRGVIAALAEQAPLRIDEMRRALRAGDASLMRSAAHALKGAASNLGATALAGRAAAVESAAKEGRIAGAQELVDELVATLEPTLERLARRDRAAAGGKAAEADAKEGQR